MVRHWGGQKEVYSCKHTKHRILVLLINYCGMYWHITTANLLGPPLYTLELNKDRICVAELQKPLMYWRALSAAKRGYSRRCSNSLAHKIFLSNSIPQDQCGRKCTMANTYLTLSADESLVVSSNIPAWKRFNKVSLVELALLQMTSLPP